MASWTGVEIYEGLEKWLKARRDEVAPDAEGYTADIIDGLLDEVRDNVVEGYFPWERL